MSIIAYRLSSKMIKFSLKGIQRKLVGGTSNLMIEGSTGCSTLFSKARILAPSRIETDQYFAELCGKYCRTLSCEERCGGMIGNPVKSTCTSTTPQLLNWCCERIGYVIRGGRLLSVLNRRRDLQKSNSIEVHSAFLKRGKECLRSLGLARGSKAE